MTFEDLGGGRDKQCYDIRLGCPEMSSSQGPMLDNPTCWLKVRLTTCKYGEQAVAAAAIEKAQEGLKNVPHDCRHLDEIKSSLADAINTQAASTLTDETSHAPPADADL